jgi:hypothetical protein
LHGLGSPHESAVPRQDFVSKVPIKHHISRLKSRDHGFDAGFGRKRRTKKRTKDRQLSR